MQLPVRNYSVLKRDKALLLALLFLSYLIYNHYHACYQGQNNINLLKLFN